MFQCVQYHERHVHSLLNNSLRTASVLRHKTAVLSPDAFLMQQSRRHALRSGFTLFRNPRKILIERRGMQSCDTEISLFPSSFVMSLSFPDNHLKISSSSSVFSHLAATTSTEPEMQDCFQGYNLQQSTSDERSAKRLFFRTATRNSNAPQKPETTPVHQNNDTTLAQTFCLYDEPLSQHGTKRDGFRSI